MAGRAAASRPVALRDHAVSPHARQGASKRGLAPRFTTDITRTTIPLAFPDSTMATLCIDVGEVAHRRRRPGAARSRMHEIELELEAGDPRRLYELAQTRSPPTCRCALEPRDQGRARLRAAPTATPPEPVRADDVDLPDKATAGSAFAAIMRRCLRQIDGNAQGVASPSRRSRVDAPDAHRRAPPALVPLARAARHRAGRASSRCASRLRWLAQALGPARDLDVFVDRDACRGDPRRRSARRAAPDARARPAKLAARASAAGARRRRRRARGGRLAALHALRARRPRRSRPRRDVDVAVRAHEASWPRRRASSPRPLLKRRHQALVALGTDLAHAAPEARHAARLAAKKLRYATEFFASLYPRQAHARLPQGARARCRKSSARGTTRPSRRASPASSPAPTVAGRRRVRRLGGGARRDAQPRRSPRHGRASPRRDRSGRAT